MVLKEGEKIHLIVRRNFENDLRRHFVGEVTDVEGTLARVEGFTFVLNTGTNQYSRRPEMRTRIVSLGDAGNLVSVIHPEADLESCKYIQSEDNRLVLTDEKTFSLDINEFGSSS